MAEELLSLKWNNHQAHFVDILTFLREQEIFVDATLACGGKLYAAHKFVLSTCSDYFKQMFTNNPAKHPIVFMKDVTCRDLEALLDFMYNGEVNVPQSSLGSLIKTAEGLQIKGLAVPDDSPHSRRDRREKSYYESRSPPAKRVRMRERSSPLPHHTSATAPHPSPSIPRIPSPAVNNTSSASQGGSNGDSLPPVEATLDEDSRASGQSGVSDSNVKPNLNALLASSDSTSISEHPQASHRPSDDPSPGPSGINKSHSKEEEMDIKQEDVVDLGEDEDGEWDGGEGRMGDGGGGVGDVSSGSENPSSFSDNLLLHTDGSLGPSAGDPMNSSNLTLGLSLGELSTYYYSLLRNLSQSQNFQGVGMGSDSSVIPKTLSQVFGMHDMRPYECHYCQKKFKLKHHLKQHLHVHTGVKPHRCERCGRTFTRRYNMKVHVCGMP